MTGYRRMGLGSRLSSWAVLYRRSRGTRVVRLYSTRQAEGLYPSFGFRPTAPRTVDRFEEDAPRRARGQEEADGHRVETLSFGDLLELYGVDRWSYGGDRSALISATLRLHPGRGLVARDSSERIKGYLVRRSWGGATCIGPFVASSPGVARLLLACTLGASDGSSVEMTVPGPAENLTRDLLREFGFRGRKDRLRMELGEESGGRLSGLLEQPPGAIRHHAVPGYVEHVCRSPYGKSFPRNQPNRLASKPRDANEGLRYQAPTIMIR
jgi:hypothetical protein